MSPHSLLPFSSVGFADRGTSVKTCGFSALTGRIRMRARPANVMLSAETRISPVMAYAVVLVAVQLHDLRLSGREADEGSKDHRHEDGDKPRQAPTRHGVPFA